MCGIVGFVNYKKDISSYRNVLVEMTETLSKRGPDEDGYYIKEHVAFGHKRLIVIDPKGRKTANGRKVFLWRIRNCV
jgi:asparagine synthase (glutamine-hydrolysing)